MSENIWQTKISGEVDGETIIRGYKLTDLISKVNFTQAIFLVLKGSLPTETEEKILNHILVAAIDHGLGAPSTTAARISASVGNDFHVALAAGVLSTGKFHGGAIEGAAKVFQKNHGSRSAAELVAHFEEKGKRLPGFGHKIYEVDPRTQALIKLAKEVNFPSKYLDYAQEIEKELEAKKAKKLPLNIDGAVACFVLEMGFPTQAANAFFLIPRVAGLSAHIAEEMVDEKPVRRLDENEISYQGETKKNI
jgi:citryl-CoA lyase